MSEKKIYESCEAANYALGTCPRPLSNSDGGHWWYIDHEEEDRLADEGKEVDYIACLCKTCTQKMRLSIEAEEYPV